MPAKLAITRRSRQQTIDRYGDLHERVKAWRPNVNPHLQEYQDLKKEILAWFEDNPADKPIIAQGAVYTLPISPRENKRIVINVLALLRKIGFAKLAQIWSPALGLVEKEVPKEKLELYIKCERTGPRRIGEPVRKEPVSAREAA